MDAITETQAKFSNNSYFVIR